MTDEELLDDLARLCREGLVAVEYPDDVDDAGADVPRFRVTRRGCAAAADAVAEGGRLGTVDGPRA